MATEREPSATQERDEGADDDFDYAATLISIKASRDENTRRILYERYGKPLESEHWGKYAVISEAGEVIVGEKYYAITREASERFHGDTFLFKIGPRAIGRI